MIQNQSSTPNNSIKLILFPKNDYCHRYRPSYDLKTFQQEIQDTQAELVDYFPRKLVTQYNEYRKTTKWLTYIFWGSTVSLAVLTHKIKFVKKIIGQHKWLMFCLRMSILVFPYLLMEKIMQEVEKEEISMIYEQIKPQYLKYKLTGDIKQLKG